MQHFNHNEDDILKMCHVMSCFEIVNGFSFKTVLCWVHIGLLLHILKTETDFNTLTQLLTVYLY